MTAARGPVHHPSDELLLDYASGAQGPAVGLFVATHLALCPTCRTEVARLEALGGIMLDEIEPVAVEEASFERVMARLGEPQAPVEPIARNVPADGPGHHVPRPLRDLLGGPLEGLAWRSLIRNIEEFPLPVERGRCATRLLRVAGGAAVPEHGHGGEEMVLVLSGGLTDINGHFLPGDCAITDSSVIHRPFADRGQPCVCLVLSAAPPRFTGLFGAVMNLVSRCLPSR